MEDIVHLIGSSFAGGVGAIILLKTLFSSKEQFDKLEKMVEEMKKDYVTHKTLELMLARITDQLTNISDALKGLTSEKGKNGGHHE